MISNREQLLAEARRAWAAYETSGSVEDFAAARQATEAAKAAGIPLAEIGRDQ
ncbi:hypothetical protein [Streptomyces sp. ME19-01-6]|uniref:hypothetical protein n=1 Tax=Streptomyces sp. ME19-01-6 TaxID=3028686 RepID=UPI0029A9864A|nr:hypothetical protein [Streptomyces sp. ME19-01-6]MDX3230598.1 hypothetical protein [Streptomyces sp. ME19-01-6]